MEHKSTQSRRTRELPNVSAWAWPAQEADGEGRRVSAGAFDPGSSDVSFMLADLYFQWCNHKIVPFLCNWFNRLSVHILRVQHELFDTLDKGGWIETLFCTFVPMTMELFCCFFILLWPTTHCHSWCMRWVYLVLVDMYKMSLSLSW